MTPSSVLPTMASSDESTMAASRAAEHVRVTNVGAGGRKIVGGFHLQSQPIICPRSRTATLGNTRTSCCFPNCGSVGPSTTLLQAIEPHASSGRQYTLAFLVDDFEDGLEMYQEYPACPRLSRRRGPQRRGRRSIKRVCIGPTSSCWTFACRDDRHGGDARASVRSIYSARSHRSR